jgi:hypothetical protein
VLFPVSILLIAGELPALLSSAPKNETDSILSYLTPVELKADCLVSTVSLDSGRDFGGIRAELRQFQRCATATTWHLALLNWTSVLVSRFPSSLSLDSRSTVQVPVGFLSAICDVVGLSFASRIRDFAPFEVTELPIVWVQGASNIAYPPQPKSGMRGFTPFPGPGQVGNVTRCGNPSPGAR